MNRFLPLAALAACHASVVTGHTTQAESAPSPLTVLHALTAADGLAARGAPLEAFGRLYILLGEAGPSGSDRCNSTALWNTAEHRAHCPGALVSLARDGSDFRVDHAFTRLDDQRWTNYDGYHPYGTPAAGPDGRIYLVTQAGGSPTMEVGEVGYGVLAAFDPRDGGYEVLHTFCSEPRCFDGMYPMGSLAIDPAGNVYGTTKGGGSGGTGTVYEWSPGGAFRYAPLPGESYGGVTLAGGFLHGTTWSGGNGAGVYFTVAPETLAVRVVDRFSPLIQLDHANDNTPIQAPLRLRDGTVIAVREFGGPFGTGMIARLEPSGITPLWSPADLGPMDVAPRFANSTGAMLNGQIVEGRDGMIYGTTTYGGAYGTGGIYRIARDGTLPQLLWSWPDAAYPYGGLVAASDGAFYGVTWNTGQIYRFAPPIGACQ